MLLLIAGSVGIIIGSVLGILIISLIIIYIYRTSSISKSRKSDITSGRLASCLVVIVVLKEIMFQHGSQTIGPRDSILLLGITVDAANRHMKMTKSTLKSVVIHRPDPTNNLLFSTKYGYYIVCFITIHAGLIITTSHPLSPYSYPLTA